ncbi:mfs general substrate transporter [Trichoderma arundinaceum]|uniref:Mfs general substrate transporter n=1 Tax=Trichoderma arundinaceum TaxID=490622 RepID=A0A395NAG7_TRIAR|nr:mfs general substrate transporter [Trichoderma arundinaceum]
MQSFLQRRHIAARSVLKLAEKPPISVYDSDDTAIHNPELPDSQPREQHEDDDSDVNPRKWPIWRKLVATLIVTAISFVVQYASAVDSAAAEKIQEEFGVSAVAESLATGLFLVGFGVGAPVSGPLSEIAGRNPVYIISFVLFMLCTMGAGLACNIGAQLALRFLAGMFGSTPLVCAGGTVSDLWDPVDQIHIFPIYATGGFLGLAVGPAIGGLVADSKLVGWRWVEWSTLVLSGFVLILVLALQPETYAPTLRGWQTAALTATSSLEGGEASSMKIAANAEQVSGFQRFKAKIGPALYRPVQLSYSEPIIILISLYLSVLYIVIFTFLPGYTFIFSDTYGFSLALRGLSFFGLGVGFLLSFALTIPITIISRRILRRDGKLSPESRLWFAMCGAPAIPIALFWMAWTTRASISCWSAIVASVLLGFGILCVFISSYQYIIYTYEQLAASGLVFVTFTRYLIAGGMVEVGIPMYGNLGVAWALTLLGILSAVLIPIPFSLYYWGPKIRQWSKHVK